MRFDEILPVIGDCGIYQILLLIFNSFVKYFGAVQVVSVVFTAGQVDFWCSDTNWTTTNGTEICADSTCQSWTFSRAGTFESSWRSQFSLVCSREKLVSICATVFLIGGLIGNTVFGILSDRHGRVLALCTSVLITWICGTALAFSPSVEFYALLRFFCGLGASGVLSITSVMIAECVTAKHRSMWVLIGSNGWNVGLCLLSIIAFSIRSHWKLELVLAAPAVLVIPFVLLFGESPRWLVAKNRPLQAYRRCLAIAAVNRKSVPPQFKDDVNSVSDTLIEQQGQQAHPSLVDLLKSKTLRWPTLLVWYNMLSGQALCFGIILLTGQFHGNIFIIFLIGSCIGVPSSLVSIFLNNRIGRPLLMSLMFFVSSVALLTIAVLWNVPGFELLVTVASIVARFTIASALDTTRAFSSELFPTLVRNAAMGSVYTAGEFGSIVAPLINILGEFWLPLPFLIYGVSNFIAAIFALLLPETRGVKLPESLEDADKEYTRPKLMTMCGRARNTNV